MNKYEIVYISSYKYIPMLLTSVEYIRKYNKNIIINVLFVGDIVQFKKIEKVYTDIKWYFKEASSDKTAAEIVGKSRASFAKQMLVKDLSVKGILQIGADITFLSDPALFCEPLIDGKAVVHSNILPSPFDMSQHLTGHLNSDHCYWGCTSKALDFLDWYDNAIQAKFVMEPHQGYFNEQIYLNYAPTVLPNYKIEQRSNMYNIGAYNIRNFTAFKYIKSFHFTGFEVGSKNLSKYFSIKRHNLPVELQEFIRIYEQRIIENDATIKSLI